MVLDSPYAIGIIFVTLALMWVLQMYLAKKQATSFLNAVNSIKGQNLEVAIGVNQPKWGRKKIYIAISANAESIICLLYTSPSPRDLSTSRMPSSA